MSVRFSDTTPEKDPSCWDCFCFCFKSKPPADEKRPLVREDTLSHPVQPPTDSRDMERGGGSHTGSKEDVSGYQVSGAGALSTTPPPHVVTPHTSPASSDKGTPGRTKEDAKRAAEYWNTHGSSHANNRSGDLF